MNSHGDKPDAKTIGDMVSAARAAMAEWPAWMRDAAYRDAETLRKAREYSGDRNG